MNALQRFLQKNQIVPTDPLPLVHTTEAYNLKRIVGTNQIEVRPCDVFAGEKLSYFFVGRAAYKKPTREEAEYWELPACLVVSFFIKGVRRIFPFDSGAFAGRRYPHFINMMDLNDFQVGDDLTAPHKLIGTFFPSRRDYYVLNPRSRERFESMFDVGLLEEEVKALHALIQDKRGRADDRRFSIEMQFGDNLSLSDKTLLAVIIPETYMADEAYAQRLRSLGGTLITYPVYPLRKEYFYYAIYEKLDQFYRSKGLYALHS